MEILRRGRWERDVHVHIRLCVSGLEAVIRELCTRISETRDSSKYRTRPAACVPAVKMNAPGRHRQGHAGGVGRFRSVSATWLFK